MCPLHVGPLTQVHCFVVLRSGVTSVANPAIHGAGVTVRPYSRWVALDQPLPAALSPSRMADFQACPRRYQHGAIERRHQPATYATTKGRAVHAVFEWLFTKQAAERTREAAHGSIDEALRSVLTDEVRADIGCDEALEAQLRDEVATIVDTYFEMEDPATIVSEGVELRLTAEVGGAPMLGILDRLDRDAEGALTIVDYKTGRVPDRKFDFHTFANAELYAALCEASLGERPVSIRLLYVGAGRQLERPVTPVMVQARSEAAGSVWRRISAYYEAGDFPATPSVKSCRFCAFKDVCRGNGVAVPV